MQLNTVRHQEVFSASKFDQRRVDIIGVGATGSHVAEQLAKLGIQNIHVWDPDVVASENIPNQTYGLQHIGQLKVEAGQSKIKLETGIDVTIHPEAVDGTQIFGDIVFLLVDKMSIRRQIWDAGIRMKLRTKLMIETRMGAAEGRIYTLNPCKKLHIERWEKTLVSDERVQASVCGASTSVGPTAEVLSGMAVWQLIRWFAIENGEDDVLENEIIFSLRPTVFLTQTWE